MFNNNTKHWLLQKAHHDGAFLLVYNRPKTSVTYHKVFKSFKAMQQFIRRNLLSPDINCLRFQSVNNVYIPFTVIGTNIILLTQVNELHKWRNEVLTDFASAEFRLLALTD